ncbi:cytochrome C biogenesis protein, partial [bacterium]|nr:cytochrome C biogenesis protein [bacterium]
MLKFFIFLLYCGLAQAGEFTMETLPVQNGGRLKPFDTYARETLTLMYGRSRYRPAEDKPAHDATKIVSTWMMVPEAWMAKEFVRVDHLGLKKALNFPEDKKFFSPEEILKSTRFGVILSELNTKRQLKEKLNPFDQAVQKLESQMGFFHEVRMGALRVAPSKDPETTTWLSVAELEEEQKALFFNVLKDYSATFTSENVSPDAEAQAQKSVQAFVESIQKNNPSLYPALKKMSLEVHYNQFSPFLKSAMFYGLAVILMFLSLIFSKNSWAPKLAMTAWISTVIAFLLHTYGFALRVYLTERPPVSNMFETVIWVAWGAILFTSWLSIVKKKNYILLSGTLVATLAMIVANSAPAILDASLQPLEPVLRSNLWLIIHV